MKLKVIIGLLALLTCAVSHAEEDLRKHAAKDAANYEFDPGSKLEDRVTDIPDMVLDFFRIYDADYITEEEPYLAYKLSDAELEEVRSVIKKTPVSYKKTISPKLLGIYFIENFLGSGMAEYIPGPDGEMYYIMIFNPKTLKDGASEWITGKEKSAFIMDDTAYDLRIDIGGGTSGFYYIFYHEITHVLDYITKITPGEPGLEAAEEYLELRKAGSIGDRYGFMRDAWEDYRKPVEEFDFEGREDITFYGMSDGPKLKISEAPAIYDSLQGTPFVTLYGAISWMEDLSEFMAMYINTMELGRPWTLQVLKDGEVIYEMKDVLKRKNLEYRMKFAGGLLSETVETE